MTVCKTIKRCPSWSKASAMMTEWSNFEHRNGALSPDRANEIAANFYAINHAKRMGLTMPKDWSKVHPSMPYQLGTWAEKIAASALVTSANRLTTYFVELQRAA